MIATFLGTMGLPHVVVRFYTNPDGRAARRTTLIVLALLGIFYLLPTVYGVLGRIYARDLLASGRADTVVLELPSRVIGGSTRRPARRAARRRARSRRSSRPRRASRCRSPASSARASARRPASRPITALRVAAAGCVVVPLVLALVGRADRGRQLGDLRVRPGRLDVLPAARARHLVARADGSRRHRRAGRRRPVRRHRARSSRSRRGPTAGSAS